jgi:gamma-glutamylcyclotransferase (GGCT)/AIG2-like uncharacterized protein YtfP
MRIISDLLKGFSVMLTKNHPQKNISIFVYGSLREGLILHHLLKGSIFAGYGKIQGAIIDLGCYPGLIIDRDIVEPESMVFGEMYYIDQETLDRLDFTEGYDRCNPEQGLYDRISTVVYDAIGEQHLAYVYVYNTRNLNLVAMKHQIISSGDYSDYLKKKHFRA